MKRRFMNRRTYLASVAAATALAGCNGSNSKKGSTTGTSSSGTSGATSSTTSSSESTTTATAKTSTTETATSTGEQQTTETETSTEEQQTTTNEPPKTNQPGSYKPMDPAVASFNDVSAWKPDSSVHVEADTDNTFVDGQSLHVTGGGGTIRRHFPTPLDVRDWDLSLAIDVPERMRPTHVRIWMKDTGGNWLKLIQEIDVPHPKGWIRINPSINDAAGSTFKINTLLISVDGVPGRKMEYWVDEIRFHKKTAQKGMVTFSFDTIDESIYTEVFPIMKDYDMRGFLSVPTAFIGESGRMTLDQIREMHDAGWEIASQSDHLKTLYGLSRSKQEQRIKSAKQTLEKHGFGDIRAFVYPLQQCDQNTVELVEKYHDFGFLGFNDSEAGQSQSSLMNPAFINRSRPNTPEAVANQLKEDAPYRGLYNLYMNHLSTPDHNYQNDPGELRNMCALVADYQKKGKLEVVQPSDLKPL